MQLKNAELEGPLFISIQRLQKKIAGIKIPFNAFTKSNDQTILTITIEKVELNKAIADKEFQP